MRRSLSKFCIRLFIFNLTAPFLKSYYCRLEYIEAVIFNCCGNFILKKIEVLSFYTTFDPKKSIRDVGKYQIILFFRRKLVYKTDASSLAIVSSS